MVGKLTLKAFAFCAIASGIPAAISQAQDQKSSAREPAKVTETKTHSDLNKMLEQRVPRLESLIERAMSSSPEMIVAQAKVKEAEASLQNAKATVVQKIISLHNERRKAELNYICLLNTLASERASLDRMRKIRASGQASADEERQMITRVNEMERTVAEEQGKVASAEAMLRLATGDTDARTSKIYRLGSADANDSELRKLLVSANLESQVNIDPTSNSVVFSGTENEHSRFNLLLTRFNQQGMGGAGAKRNSPVKRTWVTERLDRIMECNFEKVSAREVLNQMQELLKVPFVYTGELNIEQEVTLKLESSQAGTVLQAIQDVTDLRFYVRDYGIFVCQDGVLPAGQVVSIQEFWKPNETLNAKQDSNAGKSEQSPKPAKTQKNP